MNWISIKTIFYKAAATTSLILILSATYSFDKLQSKPIGAIRVLSYNIYHAEMGLENIVKVLRKSNADIIALQEVDVNTRRAGKVNQPSEIAKKLNMHWVFSKHFDYDGGQYGLAVLSRYNIDNHTSQVFKKGRAKAVQVTLNISGKKISIWNTHLQWTDTDWPEDLQIKTQGIRKTLAQELLESAKKFNGPIILLGDFNIAPGSEVHSSLSNNLTDSCLQSGGFWPRTFPSHFPSRRIDYIWLTNHFRLQSCETIPTLASDHRPVWADIFL